MADKHQNRTPNSRLTIGMLADGLDNQYQHPILSGVVDAAKVRGVNLLCFSGKVQQGLEAQDNKIYHLASNETIEGISYER